MLASLEVGTPIVRWLYCEIGLRDRRDFKGELELGIELSWLQLCLAHRLATSSGSGTDMVNVRRHLARGDKLEVAAIIRH